MSTTIDERVVEMRFDNKQFESNVQTSLSTLDRLKKSLNLSGAAKGFDEIDSASKKVNMNGLANAVESVRLKFSALEVMAVTALANITNSALNAGKRIVSALTIDPIKTGFQEYETQIGAVQTILANTQHEGTNLQQVNRALDELNTYADKTIYNFTEMTRNIGTFTAAGVNLQTSVDSIKGIANLAAVSVPPLSKLLRQCISFPRHWQPVRFRLWTGTLLLMPVWAVRCSRTRLLGLLNCSAPERKTPSTCTARLESPLPKASG